MGNSSLSKINIYLSFLGYIGDPDDITSIIDLAPSSVNKKGQYKDGKTVPIKRSFWSSKLIETDGIDIGSLVDDAILTIYKKSMHIRDVSEKSEESYIGVTVRLGRDSPSINISNESLLNIGNMKLKLDIDLFY